MSHSANRSRLVVTGAAGFIGSTLVDDLKARGDDVMAIDCFTDYYARSWKDANSAQFKVEPLNLNSDRLTEYLRSGDVVIHLAGQPGVRSSFGKHFGEYVDHNITATGKLLEACTAVGVKKFILGSTSSVYGDVAVESSREVDLPAPVSPYGVTKLAGENLTRLFGRNFGLDFTILRFFTVYGPRQRPDMAFSKIFQSMKDGEPFNLNGSGEQLRDFTYVGDVISAINYVIDSEKVSGETLNVGGGDCRSMNEVISMIEAVAGRKLEIVKVRMPDGEPFRTGSDCSKLRSLTGWSPVVNLSDGIAHQYEWSLRFLQS